MVVGKPERTTQNHVITALFCEELGDWSFDVDPKEVPGKGYYPSTAIVNAVRDPL